MKKFFGVLLCLVVCMYISTKPIDYIASAQDVTFYRITNATTMLYKTSEMNDMQDNIYFELPQSYFVKYLEPYDQNIAHVSFDGIDGYVFIQDLQECYSTPVSPYPQNITLNILDVCNAVIYSTPSQNGDYIGLIPFNASNIKYYGKINGQEAVPTLGNAWYYIRYQSFEQGCLSGYIYAPLTTDLTEIPTNTEVIKTEQDEITQTTAEISANEFKNTDTIFIIAGLIVLAIILLYLLFKPDKRKKSTKNPNVSRLPKSNTNYIEKHTENDEFDF